MKEAWPNQEFSSLDDSEPTVTLECQIQLMELVWTIILWEEASQYWGHAGVMFVGLGSITEWRGCSST